jgi:hypothetical protein
MRPPPPPAVPQPAPPSDSAPALEGSWIPQGRYTPLVGPAPAVAQGEPDAGGSFLGSDTLAGAPTSSPSPLPATPDVVGVGRDSVHGGDVVAPAAVVPPPAHVRAPVDHPGPIDALANGQGMALVLGRPGGRVVLFEALEDGDRSLPSDVTGRWAVVRGCRRFRIDLSQRRGPAGALRGVGRGDNAPLVGIAVPANGCERVRRRLIDADGAGFTGPEGLRLSATSSGAGAVIESSRGWRSAPLTGVANVRAAGALGAVGAAAESGWDAWFVAFNTAGRPLAFMHLRMSSGRVTAFEWVLLGGDHRRE